MRACKSYRDGGVLLCMTATLACGLAGCFEPEVRVCNFVTSAECAAGESCIGPDSERCPEAENVSASTKAACLQPSAERCAAMGSGKAGQTCQKHTDCAVDMFCIGSSEGTCRNRCHNFAGGCAKNETCVDVLPGLNTPDDVGYCLPPVCDPITNTGCKAGESCLPGVRPRCAPAGDKAIGETCDTTSECTERSFCLSSTKRCVGSCDVSKGSGEPAGCKAGETCKKVTSEGADLPEGFGRCVPPCDITSDAGCPEEGQCLKIGDSPPKCYKAGSIEVGEVCYATGDCVHGAHCIQDIVNFKKVCAPKCDPADLAKVACNSGETCLTLKDYPIGYCGKAP